MIGLGFGAKPRSPQPTPLRAIQAGGGYSGISRLTGQNECLALGTMNIAHSVGSRSPLHQTICRLPSLTAAIGYAQNAFRLTLSLGLATPNHALQRPGTAALSGSCVPAAELGLVRRSFGKVTVKLFKLLLTPERKAAADRSFRRRNELAPLLAELKLLNFADELHGGPLQNHRVWSQAEWRRIMAIVAKIHEVEEQTKA
jgi:hypothetical protein